MTWAGIADRDGYEAAVWSGPLTFLESIAYCLPRALSWLSTCDVIVDYGCGIGRMTGPIASALPDSTVVGIDPEPAMIGEARRRHPDVQFTTDTNMPVRSTDAVFSMLVLQHLPHVEQVELVGRWVKALRPRGRVLAQVAIGVDDVPLSRQWQETDLHTLFAGLDVTVIARDDLFPTWRWVYACL